MARSSIVTAVSLDQFANIMGIHPALFNGITGDSLSLFGNTSRELIYQTDWQNHDQLSRSAIADALLLAEQAVARQIGVPIYPQFFADEEYYQPILFAPSDGNESPFGIDESAIRDNREATALDWGYVSVGGTEARTAIATNEAITYSDEDGDGIDDTWTVSAATTVTDPQEIKVYFSSADRMGEDLDEDWRIRPVKVSISGGTVTITGSKWAVVKPAKQSELVPTSQNGIDPTDANNFITTVDIGRHYCDNAQDHVTYTWQRPDITTQTGFLIPHSRKSVMFYAGTYTGGAWDEDNFSESRSPDKLTVSYQAGLPTDNHGNVPRELAVRLCHYAVGLISRNLGNVTPAERAWMFWAEDLVNVQRPLPYGADEYNNPLGTWRGAIEMWRWVVDFKKDYYERR